MDNQGKQPGSIIPPGSPLMSDGSSNGVPSKAPSDAQPPAPDISTDFEDPGFFNTTNLVILAMMAALIGYLLWKFTLLELLNVGKAALGLSFVIFIHELGHFLAAKWCGVNVTTFSIGFGPAIPGCSFSWGETTYKLAVLPLGGYVQMVGQVDGDEGADDNDDPRSYRRKSVPQRMLIISAGVIMNAILAVICFIAIYQGPGREHPVADIGSIDAGGPLAKLGVPSGATITKIGSFEKPTFSDLKHAVIFSRRGEKIPLTYVVPGEEPVTIAIESRKDASDKIRAIGVTSATKLQFAAMRKEAGGPYYAGSTAADAKFESGDVIVGSTDPDHPDQAKGYRADLVTEIKDNPRHPDKGQRDFFEFAKRMQRLADKDVVIRVLRGKDKQQVDVKVAPMFRPTLGVVMHIGPILSVRDGSEADKKGVLGPREVEGGEGEKKKLKGDLIDAVSVKEANGTTLEYSFKDKTLDPERLPHQLRQWSDRLDAAKFAGPRLVTLHLSRHRAGAGPDEEKVTVELKWDKDWRFQRVQPISPNAPMPIPELGIAYQIQARVLKAGPESQFQVDDVIKHIRLDAEGFKDDIKYKVPVAEGQWAHISRLFLEPHKIKELEVEVERDKKREKFVVTPGVDKDWGLAERGWLLTADTTRSVASNPFEAIAMGFDDTLKRMTEVFLTLRGIIMGDIDKEVVGGPLTIAHATYRFASMDFAEFAFFLGLISINLAVVNFLPIPVLDGGHMVFLIYEGIRGRPASEAVRIWATYAGLAIILCLMLFVLYLDVTRLFF